MTATYVCLMLVAGRELREELFGYLSEQADVVSGFTASDAAGHGPAEQLRSAAERVRGRADRVLVRIIMKEHSADQLIERLRTQFVGTHLMHWTTPVTSFGVID